LAERKSIYLENILNRLNSCPGLYPKNLIKKLRVNQYKNTKIIKRQVKRFFKPDILAYHNENEEGIHELR